MRSRIRNLATVRGNVVQFHGYAVTVKPDCLNLNTILEQGASGYGAYVAMYRPARRFFLPYCFDATPHYKFQ